MDERQSPIDIFIDYSKTFDTVDHAILLSKLEKNGIRDLPLKMITSYLTSRTHRVKLGKKFSDALTVTKIAPQGSLQGPYYF